MSAARHHGRGLALLALLSLLCLAAAPTAQAYDEPVGPIYAVDFASPLHTVGSAPTTGAGPWPRLTPTSIPRLPVEVVGAYGDLLDQPVAFPGPGRGVLDFSLLGVPARPAYRLSTRVVVDEDLRVLLFTPSINFLHFRPDGDVALTLYDTVTRTQSVTIVAQITPGDGAAHDLMLSLDLAQDRLEVHLDGERVHASDFGGQSDLTLLRLQGTRAAADDVLLDDAPEDEVLIPAQIQVRPGSDGAARLNLRSRGMLPVALLSDESLAAADVDPGSLQLADADGSDAVTPLRSMLVDVDEDGDDDLLLHFSILELVLGGVLSCDTAALTLSGATLGGDALAGSADVDVQTAKK